MNPPAFSSPTLAADSTSLLRTTRGEVVFLCLDNDRSYSLLVTTGDPDAACAVSAECVEQPARDNSGGPTLLLQSGEIPDLGTRFPNVADSTCSPLRGATAQTGLPSQTVASIIDAVLFNKMLAEWR